MPRMQRICEWCGVQFIVLGSRVKRGGGRFCSYHCSNTYLNKQRFSDYMSRFWVKVDKNGPIPVKRPDLGRCWLWHRPSSSGGYGSFKVDGKSVLPHRVAYEAFRSPIPIGLTIDHLCFNPLCVNPSHLEPVTMRENILRGNGRAAINLRKTHCIRGHIFDAANTRITGGHRGCKMCASEIDRARKKAQRVERRKLSQAL